MYNQVNKLEKEPKKKQKDGNYKEHKLIKQKAKLSREHKAKTWFLNKTQN